MDISQEQLYDSTSLEHEGVNIPIPMQTLGRKKHTYVWQCVSSQFLQ